MNFESGCSFEFESTKLYAHLGSCEYRPIKCTEDSGNACGNKECELKDFCSHLTEQHNGEFIDMVRFENADAQVSIGSELAIGTTKQYKWTLNHMQRLTMTGYSKKLPVSYFEYDGNVFLLHRGINKGLLTWITLLGGLNGADAFKYICKITISSFNPQSDDVEPSFVIPVLPIHGNYELESMLDSGSCAFIHHRSLKKLFREHLVEDIQKLLFWWKIKIEINLR